MKCLCPWTISIESMDDNKVGAPRDNNPILSLLQDELYNVIYGSDKYNGVSIGSVIGVLEFLKWNVINGIN